MQDAVVFENFFSSATSTLMAITYLFHGNDLEFDTSAEIRGHPAGAGIPAICFSILQERGYDTRFICLNGFHASGETRFASWPDDLPPVWATNDFPTLFRRFDELTDAAPFAIYAWDLVSHIEHSLALAPFSGSLTDQVRRACGVADHAVGEMLGILARKGLLDNTTVVMFGDHGDDFWTHGFKGGMVHGTEPYTQITWTPCAIRDPVAHAVEPREPRQHHRHRPDLSRAAGHRGAWRVRPWRAEPADAAAGHRVLAELHRQSARQPARPA
jgi:membrane-anchored protein YejM (alkaline phosphatase superfamily)